ncbi:MAG: CHAT domain-containing protein [Candidatus Riflebacteria bacterium]|nr:CHAT domain-containing protein [Candidatus Riflebacteria bacterium]
MSAIEASASDKLALWVDRIRRQYRRGELPESHANALESLPGWRWVGIEAPDERWLALLARFVEDRGWRSMGVRTAIYGMPIGAWVEACRVGHRRKKLHPSLVRSLEGVRGWSWTRDGSEPPARPARSGGAAVGPGGSVRQTCLPGELAGEVLDPSFEKACSELRSFLAHRPASDLRSNTVVEGRPLGRWVEHVRLMHRKGLLSRTRIERLEAIPGWLWSAPPKSAVELAALRRRMRRFYEQRCELLRRFVIERGWDQLRSDTVFEGIRLGTWVVRARKLCDCGNPPPDLLDALTRVPGWLERPGFDLTPGLRKQDVRLMGMPLAERRHRRHRLLLLALRRFLGRHGWSGLKSYTSFEGLRLGQWVFSCRTRHAEGTLDPWLRAQLETFEGWRWAPQQDRREAIIRAIDTLVREEGWSALESRPHREGVDLCSWIAERRSAYRRGRLGRRYIERLEAVPAWSWTSGDDPGSDRVLCALGVVTVCVSMALLWPGPDAALAQAVRPAPRGSSSSGPAPVTPAVSIPRPPRSPSASPSIAIADYFDLVKKSNRVNAEAKTASVLGQVARQLELLNQAEQLVASSMEARSRLPAVYLGALGKIPDPQVDLLRSVLLDRAALEVQVGRPDRAEADAVRAMGVPAGVSDQDTARLECLALMAEIKGAQGKSLARCAIDDQIVELLETRLKPMPLEQIARERSASSKGAASPKDPLAGLVDPAVVNLLGIHGRYSSSIQRHLEIRNFERALEVSDLPEYRRLNSCLDTIIRSRKGPADVMDAKALAGYSQLTRRFQRISILVALDRHRKALEELPEIETLIKSCPGGESALPAVSFSRATCEARLGLHDRAARSCLEALRLLEQEVVRPREALRCRVTTHLAALRRQQGRPEAALDLIRSVESPVRRSARPLQGGDLQRLLYEKGMALVASKRPDEALAALKEAIDLVERTRSTLGSEQLRRSFVGTAGVAYDAMVRLLLSTGKPAAAIQYVERAKARAFVDLLGHVDKTDLVKGDQAKRGEYRRLEEELKLLGGQGKEKGANPLTAALVQLSASEGSSVPTTRWVDLMSVRDRLSRQMGAEFSDLVTVDPVGLPDLAKLIGPDTTVVWYFGPRAEEKMLAFVADAGSLAAGAVVTSCELPATGQQLQATVERLRQSLAGEGVGSRGSGRAASGSRSLIPVDGAARGVPEPPELRQLHEALIRPIEAHVTRHRRLVVVPHDFLNFVPFSALTDRNGSYLVSRVDLVSLPSATALRFCRAKNAGQTRSVLAYALGNLALPSTAPLPHTLTELAAVEAAFGKASRATFRERELDPGKLSRLVRDRDVIHLATHGFYEPLAPMESAVLIGDGRLTARQVMSLDLRAWLVFLSACQTGLGRLVAGDELVGLTRAFIYAGTPSVLSTLWSIPDESTSVLVSHFYEAVRSGMDKGAALRHAQTRLRERYRSPRHWAAFVLSGDWR